MSLMRVLVMGHGHMGRIHADTLRRLGYLVTTVDPRPEAKAQHTRVPPGMYFEAGVVAVPIPHLAEVAADVEFMCNRLLIEKPGAATYAEARELRGRIWASRPVVGYTERFNPQVRAYMATTNYATRSRTSATFVRWNERPTEDAWLDLTVHDIDLSMYMELEAARFDTRAGVAQTRRVVQLERDGMALRNMDLMAHRLEPVTAQWHAVFMRQLDELCSLRHAELVLQRMEELRREMKVAA